MTRSVLLTCAASLLAAANPRVALVTPADLPAPARHGLAKLEQALTAKGFAVCTAGPADFFIRAEITPGASAESLAIERTTVAGKPALALRGADATGLMYAALDTAERIAASHDTADPLAAARPIKESPELRDRAVSIYTMQRAYCESRLYDERYWRTLLRHAGRRTASTASW